MLNLQQYLNIIPYNPGLDDQWIFIWGNPSYTSSRYYRMVFQNFQAHGIFKKIWKSKCTPRLKFFAWLIFVDRLNTRNMLARRHFNVQPNTFCVMCTGMEEEDITHLLFYFPFSFACWSKLGFHWSAHLDPGDKVLDLISQQQMPFLMDIFILAAWEIWKLHNAKNFYNGTPSIRLWLKNFKCLVKLQLMRVREDLHTPS